MKKITISCIAFLLVAASWQTAALAAPPKGFGIMFGSIETDRTAQDGTPLPASQGSSIGVDYQWSMSDAFTLNLALHSSAETFPSIPGVDVGHGAIIFGGRLWFGDTVFIGLHIGSYSEVLSSGPIQINGAGGGSGFEAGVEFDQGFFIGFSVDSATVEYDLIGALPTDITTTRLHLGYRFH